MTERLEEAIKDSLKPVKTVGRLGFDISKKEILRKVAPTPPGGEKSFRRRILEKILDFK